MTQPAPIGPPAPLESVAAVFVDIDTLVPWEGNPRINGHTIPLVAASIRRFGFVAPAVVWTSKNELVAGHTRRLALLSILADDPSFVPMGCPAPRMVPVRFHEFTDENEAHAYAIADNHLTERADWDYEALGDLLGTLQDTGDADLLLATGWQEHDIANLLAASWEPPPLEDLSGSVQSGGPKPIAITFTPDEWTHVSASLRKWRDGGGTGSDAHGVTAISALWVASDPLGASQGGESENGERPDRSTG